MHRHLILALERQRFPDKTPVEADRWQWVDREVAASRRGRAFDVVTPDVAGEAVMAELENPKSNRTVRALIGKCSGMVVLADIAQVVADGQGQELFAMQLASYLDTLKPTGSRRKVDIPVALSFTNADLCDEPVQDPEAFARANVSGLWRLCGSRLQRYRFFCSGIAGSVAALVDRHGQETLVPLRIEPRGIFEPFAWLLTQLR